jgi:hypothetical protein
MFQYELIEIFRDYRKEYKKRVFRRLNVQLADGLQFSVGLYILLIIVDKYI